jgi:hypothetical protein
MTAVLSTATATGTVTVNAAFFQEIKEVNQELWNMLDDARQRIERPLGVGQCRSLLELLGRLRDQLALHFALEEAYGYFDDPEFVAPALGHEAENLRAEHKDIYVRFCRLVELAEKWYYANETITLARCIGPVFRDFDRRLQRHEAKENALIFDMLGDTGVGD